MEPDRAKDERVVCHRWWQSVFHLVSVGLPSAAATVML